MSRKIFINLPVKDLSKSVTFFTGLGFSFNPQFTNESGACMVVSDTIFVMLLVEPFFSTFTKKKIADAKQTTEVLLCLSAESRNEVDEMVKLAVANGGSIPNEKQDHGWMYSHSFEDLDGHVWEIAFIDENAVPQNP